jgi:hypothetical protein
MSGASELEVQKEQTIGTELNWNFFIQTEIIISGI